VTSNPDWIPVLMASGPAVLRMAWDIRLAGAWKRRSQPPVHRIRDADLSTALILCVHNDLEALCSIWPLWREQRFPEDWDVQWIVVDDGSTDGTKAWLEARIREGAPDLTVVQHAKHGPGKKGALAAGIEASRHDRLVLTDADCLPGPEWAFNMAQRLGDDGAAPHVLLGFSLPQGGPALPAFDALRVAWQYGCLATMGRAYMGVGRNMAYRKSDWVRLGGFVGHSDLAGGDDDLFVQDAVRSGLNCLPFLAPTPSAACPTQPADSLSDGAHRKRRHLTTAPRYGARSRLTLAADAALDPAVAIMAVGCGLLHIGGWIPLVAAGLALTVRSATLSSFARDLDLPYSTGIRALWLGPLRWGFLAVATLSNLTSSPTWTQRAPTRRS